MKRRLPPLLLPTRRGDPRASAAAFVLQLVLITIIVPALVVPVAFELLRDDRGREVTPERISFIAAAPSSSRPSRVPPRSGGDGRVPAAAPAPVAPPLIAPTAVPTGVRTTTTPARETRSGIGPLVGGGGPTQGIRPSFTDKRLWLPQSDVVEAPLVPMTRADSLQAVLHASAASYLDSVRRVDPGGRAPGDWTFDRNGKKYGIDSKYIRLGDFSIPTALLALLPMNNVQANPTGMERARRLSSMRSEIMEQAERAQRDDDFYAAVRALRERKERERREAEKKKAEVVQPAR